MDSESTRLLWDLRAALLRAMTESRDMRRALDRLREYGWSAYVVIDESGEESDSELDGLAVDAAAARPADTGERPADGFARALSGADRTLLRSLGIDPRPEPRGV